MVAHSTASPPRDDVAVVVVQEVIRRNMTRGERALVLVTTEQRQRQLVFAPFMAAAANISSYLKPLNKRTCGMCLSPPLCPPPTRKEDPTLDAHVCVRA